jgi:hypothetical protein
MTRPTHRGHVGVRGLQPGQGHLQGDPDARRLLPRREVQLPDGKVLVLGGNKAYPTVANGDQPEGLHRPDGHRPGAAR